ncbi:MAG: hypothetical protein WAS27_04080 [Candidatus Saccharimonadales bacterium]
MTATGREAAKQAGSKLRKERKKQDARTTLMHREARRNKHRLTRAELAANI